MGPTNTSDSWTGDKCSIYWTVNFVFRLSLAWAITWPLRPRVVRYAESSARPSRFRGLGAITMLVAPQSMRARTRCISPLPSLIKTSWTIWDVSGLDVPHKYSLDMRAFGLSNNTLDFKAIRCGCKLSIVTHPSLHCHCVQTQFRRFEPLPSGQMSREAYEFFYCWFSKDFCRLICCPPSLFGASIWSCCCGGIPPREFVGQKLAVWFADPHCQHLPVERRLSKNSVETHGVGSKPDDCPPPPDLPCLFISSNSTFYQKHPGVLDGSDGSDRTSYPLTEKYTLTVAQATGRVA